MLQFIIDNQNVFVCTAILILLILIAKYVIPYAQNKNWISKDTIENTRQMLELYELLVNVFKVNDKYKSDSLVIYNACVTALNYVDNVMNVTSDDEKKKIISETVEKVLVELKIEIDDSKKKLIEMGINYAFEMSKK